MTTVVLSWAALATGCTQGGQSGDLNEDALGRNNGEEPGDSGARSSMDDDEPSTDGGAARPIPPDEEPEPIPNAPEPPSTSEPEPNPAVPPPSPMPAAVDPSTPGPAFPQPAPMLDGGCGIVSYEENIVDPVELGFDGVNAIAFYGDGSTTLCAAASSGRLCVSGSASNSGEDYTRWGAGVALVVEPSEGAALDASALDVTAVGFELSAVSGRAVRVGLQQVDDPEIADPTLNFSQNSFYWGGSNPTNMTEDATVTIAFDQFRLPSWTLVVDPQTGASAEGMIIDASLLSSLHFEISNNPTDADEPYGFCVSEVAWRRADGSAADVPAKAALDAGVSE
jgi:hypothetical protein